MAMRFSSFLLMSLLFVVVWTGCSLRQGTPSSEANTGETQSEKNTSAVSAHPYTVPPAFQQQLGEVLSVYFPLKEAFVSAEPDRIKQCAVTVSEKLKNIDPSLLEGEAQKEWKGHLDSMEKELAALSASTDLEAQQLSFQGMTKGLYQSIKAFGVGDKKAYYQFCPMAFNDQGGYWLSDQEEIRNPYFSGKMLTCGMVEETLQ